MKAYILHLGTAAQIRAQHARNAEALKTMKEKAERTGKKVNKYTAQQLAEMEKAARKLAQTAAAI